MRSNPEVYCWIALHINTCGDRMEWQNTINNLLRTREISFQRWPSLALTGAYEKYFPSAHSDTNE
jgi:hypothetical protein